MGVKAPIDAAARAIIDGRLFLAFEKSAVDRFVEDVDEKIAKADANWQRLRDSDQG